MSNILSSDSILLTVECCCWKEQSVHLHQKSYEYQQEMSSRIKTLKRDWHSKKGCKDLYSSSFDPCFVPFTSELLELACVSLFWNRGSSPSFLFHAPLIHFTFSTNIFLPAKEPATQDWGALLSLLLFFASFFHMGRMISATCVRHHIGFMLLWALSWMRWPASETIDSHSHLSTPPLLAFNTPI